MQSEVFWLLLCSYRVLAGMEGEVVPQLSWALSLQIQSWEQPCVLAVVFEMFLWENGEQQM